ncbi:hypothetical protein Tco_0081736 [Tanacetum coccineum]
MHMTHDPCELAILTVSANCREPWFYKPDARRGQHSQEFSWAGNALIAEMEALEDQGEIFDTLMDLRDGREAARTKLQGLNGLITKAEQEIETKEAQVQAMNG